MAERFFNTTGPVVAADHHCLPPLERLDLDELLRLIVWLLGRFAGKSEPAMPARRYVVECKILHGSMDATITEGLEQTLGLHGPMPG